MGRSRPAEAPGSPANTQRSDRQPAATPQPAEAPPGTAGTIAALLVAAGTAEAARQALAEALLPTQTAALVAKGAEAVAEYALAIASLALADAPDPRIFAPRPALQRSPEDDLYAAGYVQELIYRARYALKAFGRVVTAPDMAAALRREAVYNTLQRQAARNRERARDQVRQAARRWGLILGWYGVLDASTTQDCRICIGKNFDVTNPPQPQGIPGGVHVFCRCWAGAPHAGAEVL